MENKETQIKIRSWIVLRPNGEPIMGTLANTIELSRSSAQRLNGEIQRDWTRLHNDGFRCVSVVGLTVANLEKSNAGWEYCDGCEQLISPDSFTRTTKLFVLCHDCRKKITKSLQNRGD